MSDLNENLQWLADEGCVPVIRYQGDGVWRASIDGDNHYDLWHDATTPQLALHVVMEAWKRRPERLETA